MQSDSFFENREIEVMRHSVLKANLDLVTYGLAAFTFGNASAIDRKSGMVLIKPSGMDYATLRPEDIVVCDLDGKVKSGTLRPSSDLTTHIHLYREFSEIGAIVHTHSMYATSWAQAGLEIPPYGTTHADYFHGPIPVTEELTDEEIQNEYELNTGRAITRVFTDRDAIAMPAVLVRGHAPFCWGRSPQEAVHHAAALEQVAQMAYQTISIDPHVSPISRHLLDRHYLRKHGKAATYGQGNDK